MNNGNSNYELYEKNPALYYAHANRLYCRVKTEGIVTYLKCVKSG